MDIKDQILAELARKSPQTAAEIAVALGLDRRMVNQCLSRELIGEVQQGTDYRWRRRASGSGATTSDRAAQLTEIARLSRYYLECISNDISDGVGAIASDRSGSAEYAELRSMPMAADDAGWFSAPDTVRILGKVRQDRTKLVAWLGYPVRLRRHRTPRWEGFLVEPVLLWRIDLPEQGDEAPVIEDAAPVLNARFLRSVAMGDGTQVANEAARLIEELGLATALIDSPPVDELIERLKLVRPDWDWNEALDPFNCQGEAPLGQISEQGIYNRAVVMAGERSPYTQGLETELKALAGMSASQLRATALGHWLNGDAAEPRTARDVEPILEVLPMNTEQRAAVVAAMTSPLTVVTGPPGTGKSQVVTNLLANCAWRGEKVLFASKNNKAVDVVEARMNGLANRPVLLRLGGKDQQTRLATHLTQVLSGTAGDEETLAYEQGLERHRALATRLRELDALQRETLDARNTVDRLDSEAETARATFGALFSGIDGDLVSTARETLSELEGAIKNADPALQTLAIRLAWRWLAASRRKRLHAALAAGTDVAARLGVPLPHDSVQAVLGECRDLMRRLRERIALAEPVVAYKHAFATLKRCPSFEELALRRSRLAEDMAENSKRLWRDWVQLAPTRLSPAQRKEVADYTAVLQAMTGVDSERVHGSVRRRARELKEKVTALFPCWAVTSLSARGRVPLEPGYFDLVVIDEASQCDIASALPLLYRAKHAVIIGDPQQLRHISALSRPRDSELQHKYDLVDTRLGWMYSVSSLFDVAAGVASMDRIVNLRDHHRSHADIVEFSNRVFYEGRLRVATRYADLKRPAAEQPGMVWEDVKGAVVRPAGGGAMNRAEALALVAALEDLLVTRGFKGNVGVVTPFRAQAQLLQQLIAGNARLEPFLQGADMLVETVPKFQGDERDVMFFSPVVSSNMPNGALNYLNTNGNLFNVAITRARGLLHVVGDRTAAAGCGVEYLGDFAAYVSALSLPMERGVAKPEATWSADYPRVAKPEQVSDWERILYRALYGAGLRPLPQYTVDQYDLDLALLVGERRLNIEIDGERYHRDWTGELCLRDQLRNQRLIELGWEVKRLWVYEIRDSLDECVDSIVRWAAEAEVPVRDVELVH